ncbi:MAG TPA: circadian clock KaiB family protein [Nitrospirales bacterium]|jgi:circadian clock protein KaiB
MSPRRKKDNGSGGTGATLVMRLFIAGQGPNSVQAIANLKVICQQHFDHNYSLEIIDTLEDPLRALADGVLITPTLIKLSPKPVTKVVGNLSAKSAVLLALGVKKT